MKLVRYGNEGAERPGLIDANGVLRDLSAHIPDIDGSMLNDAALERLRDLGHRSPTRSRRLPTLCPCCGKYREVSMHRPELFGSRSRNWRGDPRASNFIFQSQFSHRWSQ